MHVYKMMLTMTYGLTMKALYIITKTKQKGCLFWQVHAFLDAYYLKSEIQGKDLLSNDP